MRFFRRTREAITYDPGRPHPYQVGHDAGIAGVGMQSLATTGSGGGPAGFAVTNRYQQTVGCAVPGCGRRADDAIHAPED